jgi:hypothetical protein
MLKQLAVCAALVVATTTVAAAGNGTNLTKYVADTTQVIFVMDVSAAKSSKLVKESMTRLFDAKPDAKAKLDEVGLDPLRDIDTVAITFGGFDSITKMGDTDSIVMIVEGRFPKGVLAKMKEHSSAATKQDGIDVFSNDDAELSIIDGKLFMSKKGHMGEVIARAKGKSKASLAASSAGKELRDVIKTAPTKSHAWGAVVLPAEDRSKTVSAQMPVNSVSFGFKFTSDVEGGLRLETPSESSAQNSTKLLTDALPQIKMMMGSLGLDVAAGTMALKQDKAAISATIKLTQTEIKALLGLVMQRKAAASAPPPPPPTAPTKPASPPSGGLGKKP